MALAFEQLPRESDKAFAPFSLYLSLGPERSLAKTAAKLGRSKVLMEKWSSKFDWPSRVAAYNSHMALVEREAAEAITRAKGRGLGCAVSGTPRSGVAGAAEPGGVCR
jgi:hypothetical protein